MNHSSPILITGATGFIGAHLLQQLLADGYTNIRCLKRPGSDMRLVQGLEGKVEWVEGDLLDPFAVEDAMRGCTHVFHGAAVVSFNPADFSAMQKVNVEGTALLVNTALHLGIEKLVYISSIAALGRTKEGVTLTEKAKWERSPFNTRYAISKFQGEQEIWRGQAEGLKVAVVNPAIVLGAGFWESGPPHFFPTIDKGFRFYPAGTTGLVDVRDVAWFMARLMASDIAGERFILNAEHYSYQQLLSEIAGALGRPAPRFKVGKLLRGIAWRIAWLQAKLSGKRPFLTKEAAYNSSRVFFYDNTKSKAAFNFQYTPIADTIQETARLYQSSAGKAPARLPLSPERVGRN